MRLYDLLEKDGWANHYNCDMTDGECNKRIAERESAEHIEKTLREQIARGIVAYHNDPKSCHKDYRHCECEVYLAIARGEPNQVTKDAIEEARKMNDSR